ncbi:glutamate ABC transporter substrate-binding protein [Streptomyces sp. 8K308]|uniref:glutamate ABC transporter substrate-binding protein n=1 Tax=Streptomyces sp. 8K308 TaxID=2530388 RepID=UPI001047C996|nr:glutamate ABC transporter substrate-binding protein [Streptomyces sp. 8K308]TDC19399.1 glutamate ABC transporter substrate-binding protein [Streptomyces sp. 8K308]
MMTRTNRRTAAGRVALGAVVAAVVLATGCGAPAPAAGPAGTVDGTSADSGIGPLAEPERCAGDRNAAESLPAARIVGDAVDAIRERGRLRVGIDLNSYRWGYREPGSTEIVGFDIDLVQAIAVDLLGDPSPEITYLAIPTDQRIDALRAGQVDMVVRTMSITCERREQVAFSTAYFETGQQLVVPDGSEITGFDESLAGARLCRADGSTAERLLDRQHHGAEVIRVPNHLDCLVRMQLGQADALMTDSALAAGHVAQDPSMRMVGEPLTSESYGVAMNLANTDLVRWVNAVLEDYRAGGTQSAWRNSYDEWLAPYLYDPRTDPPPVPPEPLYRE